jgi:hypothetical protein
MQTRFIAAALKVLQELEGDNGCKFDFLPERLTEVAEGLARMEADGVVLNDENLSIIGQGWEDDHSPPHGLFTKDGYEIVNTALELVLDSEIVDRNTDASYHKPGL